MRCYRCGAQMNENYKFCPECGINLAIRPTEGSNSFNGYRQESFQDVRNTYSYPKSVQNPYYYNKDVILPGEKIYPMAKYGETHISEEGKKRDIFLFCVVMITVLTLMMIVIILGPFDKKDGDGEEIEFEQQEEVQV